MATASDLIKSALKLINVVAVGETPSSEDADDARLVLNDILEEWSLERMMVVNLVNETQTITANTESYTIGSGGDWDTDRPIRIESAFIRDSSNYDYPLNIVDNEVYQNIVDKNPTSSLPGIIMYNQSFPLGTIYLWPVPIVNLAISLSTWKPFTAITALSTTITLPPGYYKALRFNLALELAPEYGKSPDPVIVAKAEETKNKIKLVNSAAKNYEMGFDMVSRTGGFNIYTG